MSPKPLTIWTNAQFPSDAVSKLESGLGEHRLVYATEMSSLNLKGCPPDPHLGTADIAFGQPQPGQILHLEKLRWVHLTTAGYTPYDREDLRNAFSLRGAVLTNSSAVYDDPCAQHVLAMMMAFARGLPQSLTTQLRDQAWPAAERRRRSFLLNGQTVLICGFGEIALRLCELLAPFSMNLIGFRRRVLGTEPIKTLPIGRLDEYLPQADHIVNLLPANDSTSEFFEERKFESMKQTAYFYNIGRGTTVHQASLAAALRTDSIAAAYLDVTHPEPLPSDDPLWHLPNCFITPHTAGGQNREMLDLVEHFLANLDRFSSGKPLVNRII